MSIKLTYRDDCRAEIWVQIERRWYPDGVVYRNECYLVSATRNTKLAALRDLIRFCESALGRAQKEVTNLALAATHHRAKTRKKN